MLQIFSLESVSRLANISWSCENSMAHTGGPQKLRTSHPSFTAARAFLSRHRVNHEHWEMMMWHCILWSLRRLQSYRCLSKPRTSMEPTEIWGTSNHIVSAKSFVVFSYHVRILIKRWAWSFTRLGSLAFPCRIHLPSATAYQTTYRPKRPLFSAPAVLSKSQDPWGPSQPSGNKGKRGPFTTWEFWKLNCDSLLYYMIFMYGYRTENMIPNCEVPNGWPLALTEVIQLCFDHNLKGVSSGKASDMKFQVKAPSCDEPFLQRPASPGVRCSIPVNGLQEAHGPRNHEFVRWPSGHILLGNLLKMVMEKRKQKKDFSMLCWLHLTMKLLQKISWRVPQCISSRSKCRLWFLARLHGELVCLGLVFRQEALSEVQVSRGPFRTLAFKHVQHGQLAWQPKMVRSMATGNRKN